ncbi:uncharacterized protein LOC103701168 [Phoenix dactylifera]|uniref:Uncharacterized protein LOC103701168 n=1 Tax=Phoenix dactylifera TaxID=42345 RepID=A0A8B8ZCF1_PHODC|nr:uncharacterized protein LOC103701168 [Phoenix dactylifera]
MGGITQIFDFNQAGTSRRFAHKRYGDGFEAPRNSLELPIEVSRINHVIHENIPYSCQVKQHSTKMNYSRKGTPMKKLIDEEMSNRRNHRQNAPSVVARLMGMDTISTDVNPKIHAKEWKIENFRNDVARKKAMESSSIYHTYPSSVPCKQTDQILLPFGNKQDCNQITKCLRLPKPHLREHPQEELLQKFKKEFEAWQASKMWEHTGALQLKHNLSEGMDERLLAQENLNKGRMARYLEAKRNSSQKKPVESNEFVLTDKLKMAAPQGIALPNCRFTRQHHQINIKDDMVIRNGAKTNAFEYSAVARIEGKQERSCSPTRIVILKPSSEINEGFDESWVGSSAMFQKDCSMEDFLEEVKERLRYEMQGKARTSTTIRGSGTKVLSNERSTDPKQIARDIAKQIRESVTRDNGTTLKRSESTRSYKSEVQNNGPDSSELIKRDTRKILSERLKNILKNEIDLEKPVANNGRSGASLLVKDKARLKSMPEFSKMDRYMDYYEDKQTMHEPIYRREQEISMAFDAEAASSRNLIRSLSAPASGTAFGKLLLEDQHILTGAQIRRKHEVSEHTSAEVRRNRKDGFNLKGRVSNLKQNIILKGRLFGKTTQLLKESNASEFDIVNAVTTAPSATSCSGITQDNSTEVPPSPASTSSSLHDEFCQPDSPSPVSPLEVPLIEYHPSPRSSGDISCNLPEPSLSENYESEAVATNEQPYDDETLETESKDKAYLKDILVAVGLYNGKPSDQAFSKWDSVINPISDKVFEQVEEAYSKYGKVDTGVSLLHHGDNNIGNKMLFDLVNEALPSVLGIPMNSSRFKRWVLDPAEVPQGKKLLDDLWHQIQRHTNPSMHEPHTIDSMVARDVRMTTWSTMLCEDIDVVGREIELVILRELIDDVVRDMCF